MCVPARSFEVCGQKGSVRMTLVWPWRGRRRTRRIRPADAFEHLTNAHREWSRFCRSNRPEDERVMVVPVAVPPQGDQIVGLLETEACIRPVMRLQARITAAELAGMAGAVQSVFRYSEYGKCRSA